VFEPSKYIASLIAAINDGAKSAQLGALAFVAIGLFLLATTFSANDKDLLQETAIQVSQLGGVQVPVALAFGLAPAVFVAVHFYTLIRYDMLVGNIRQLVSDLPAAVPREVNRERCRQLLANVEIVQALVTPRGSRSFSRLFRWTVLFIVAAFPISVLLLVQIGSLRLQDEVINAVYQVSIALDLALLVWFFTRHDLSRMRDVRASPLWRIIKLCCLPAIIMAMDVVWLQVPGLDDSVTVGRNIADYRWPVFKDSHLDSWLTILVNLPRQPIDLILCGYRKLGWGCRFLTVAKQPIVGKVWDSKTFVELRSDAVSDAKRFSAIEGVSLRDRSLRFGVFGSSELFAADLTGAQLQYANLLGAQLQHAELRFAQLSGAILRDARLQFARLEGANLQAADLSGARLKDVNLLGAQLQNVRLFETELQVANLPKRNYRIPR
jgi:hypothetical protein